MSWDIKVWHEAADDTMRLTIEAGPQVPDEVISSVAGSYWFEEVQLGGEEWDEDEEDFLDEPEGGPGGYHG
ncbi:MAG: hypothetical protein ACRDFS_10535 [Chloroflexota bacterium]